MDKKHLFLTVALCCGWSAVFSAERPAAARFHEQVQPLLAEYCSDCHADGARKGGVAFDEFKSPDDALSSNRLWFAVLKNVRAGLMPPPNKPRPSAAELKQLEAWIKYDAFGIDPARPDPGRVTVRRLNRVEYRNTIRDLTGYDYDTAEEFPADDTGYGFDNIGDVLTLPPMLMEKYLDAARTIITKTVPVTPWVMSEKSVPGYKFHRGETNLTEEAAKNPESLSYYEKSTLTNHLSVEHAGRYQLAVDLSAHERFVDNEFDYNQCRLVFKVDGRELFAREYVREGGKQFHYEFPVEWKAGRHELAFELQPLTPDAKHVRTLTLRLEAVTARGPADEKFWVRPKNFERFFTQDAPKSAGARRAYARELLGRFAGRAFRRPADADMLDRLVKLAENEYRQPGETFEGGIAHAMIAVLASPRFLFREEAVEPRHAPGSQPLIEEYSLASRLSYFLWSSMPDDELFRLAAEGALRKNLSAQVKRMLADPRSDALMQNFTGQWLQARDIETVAIDARAVLAREEKPDPKREHLHKRFWELKGKHEKDLTPEETVELEKLRVRYLASLNAPRTELTDEIRRSMRHEVEMYFGGILHEDRDVIELVDSDYTYLNKSLARQYGLTNLDVTGSELRRVKLPADSPRGGVLTMGAVLAVTSNPTRTSPVKRGLFILDNILGNPTPPPPPNIPPLEDSEKGRAGHNATLRTMLELHRNQPLCASCHDRMDPLGLAFEHFNALGLWREAERDQPIDCAGKLSTGEPFKNVKELKHILATNHRVEFYRTLTEKLLTYALGRGLEYSDVETVDQIVERLQQNDGRSSALLSGIIESAPFQMRRESAKFAQAGPE